jgi:3-oxoacyl-[acyl-carrier-protein] synthase II
MTSFSRVVVTGVGVVSSIGMGRERFWSNLLEGRDGFSKVTSFDTDEFSSCIGAEIKEQDVNSFVNEPLKKYGRASKLAIASTKLALWDAGLDSDKVSECSPVIIIGTTNGESQVLEEINDKWVKHGEDSISKDDVLQYPGNLIAINIANELQLDAESYLIPTACAAGNYAIGYGYDKIRSGRSTIAIVGGSDAFSRTTFSGFNRMFSMAPERCQPFDRDRKGIIVGEGSGILILESLENARARNAQIYAEMLGYALSCDASHMTIPSLHGVVSVMERALVDARADSSEIDYVSAHGTGTKMNDKTESAAINRVFNNRKIAVSSIKSMLGHTMGAASAIEAIACCLAIKYSRIPGTMNFETGDSECDIDCVPNVSRVSAVNVAMNNSFAFGGNNACTIFRKY